MHEKENDSKVNTELSEVIHHKIKELEQEKIILESINQFLIVDKISSDELIMSLGDKLKNPMVPIKAYVDMLILGQFGELNETQRKKMELIKSSIIQLDKNLNSTIHAKPEQHMLD